MEICLCLRADYGCVRKLEINELGTIALTKVRGNISDRLVAQVAPSQDCGEGRSQEQSCGRNLHDGDLLWRGRLLGETLKLLDHRGMMER